MERSIERPKQRVRKLHFGAVTDGGVGRDFAVGAKVQDPFWTRGLGCGLAIWVSEVEGGDFSKGDFEGGEGGFEGDFFLIGDG